MTDHLGSTRAIVANGVPIDGKDYLPFGKPWERADAPTSDNRYLFNGKESQAHVGVNYLDYGARMYDPELGRWTTIDPLVEAYTNISPYTYCLNNPMTYIDPDGKKVRFATGVSEQFKTRFAATVRYMNSRGTSGGLAKLERSSEIYYIQEGDPAFHPKTNIITWDPKMVLSTGDDVVLFPATILGHEIDHGVQKDSMTPEQFNEARTPDEQNPYGNKIEEETIKGVEQNVALKHGDIQSGEVTRTDHTTGKLINVKNLPEDTILEDFDKEIIKSKLLEISPDNQ